MVGAGAAESNGGAEAPPLPPAPAPDAIEAWVLSADPCTLIVSSKEPGSAAALIPQVRVRWLFKGVWVARRSLERAHEHDGIYGNDLRFFCFFFAMMCSEHRLFFGAVLFGHISTSQGLQEKN